MVTRQTLFHFHSAMVNYLSKFGQLFIEQRQAGLLSAKE